MKKISFDQITLSENSKPFIVAEIGINFNGDMDLAKKTILEDKNNLEKELNLKKQKFDDEIDGEIKNVEKEIKSFQLTSVEKINDIAKEIVNSLMTKIIGTEVNESNLKAVIESSAKKIDQKQI